MRKQAANSDTARSTTRGGSVDAPKFGVKLRFARKLKGLKLSEVAAASGCSESLISKIENDQATPSVTLLHRLAQTLETNIAWFFALDDSGHEIVMRKGSRREIDFGKSLPMEGTSVESLAPFIQGNLLQVMLFTVAPNGKALDFLSHQGEDFGYVLEGEVIIIVDDVEYSLSEGDTFQFSSDRPHGYHNRGNTTAKIIWVNTPPTF